MEHPEDKALERLLGQVELPQAPFGFEHRVLTRLRAEREQTGWSKLRRWWLEQTLGFQGGLTTACAALVLMASVGGFWQWEQKQKTERLVSALDAFEQYQQDQEKWPELDLYTSQ
jgi:hypothetical protein